MLKIKKTVLSLGVAASLLLISQGLLPSQAQALGFGDSLGLSPFWEWKTLDTAHFSISFPKELSAEAQLTAKHLEEAHSLMTESLYWEPKHRTQVLVIDNADAANGLTSAVSRFGMILYLTPPDNFFSTAYYEDWLRLLVFHEYTHFLNMDATRGIYTWLRYGFGDLLLPNSLWPTWMLEGLAVYNETAYTRVGRGRSAYYDMVLRSAVEENVLGDPKFITLDKVNGTNPYYPGGETPYLFGYHLMNEVASHNKTTGTNILGWMSKTSSERFPYFINGNLENLTGKDWYETWNDWLEESKTRLTSDLERIKSQPLTAVTKLPGTDYSSFGATVSPDGKWLAYTQDSLHQREGLYLRNLETGFTKRIEDKILGVGHSFTPDSKTLIYSSLQKESQYTLFSELKAHDLEKNSSEWLTSRLRARDPSISPAGNQVTFTTADSSGVTLSVAKFTREGKHWKVTDVRKLFVGQKLDRVSTPKFSPDSKHIVFSLHRNGKIGEEIFEVDLAARKLSALIADQHMNRFPTYDSEGKIHFVSDLTGVDNIYRWNSAKAVPSQVTNVTTGIWMPTFAPDHSVYASVYGNDGWSLAKVELSDKAIPSAQVRVSVPPAPEPYVSPSEAAPGSASASAEAEIKDYSPWPSLLPRQWAPILLIQPNETLVGGQILGYDATDRHRYVLLGAFDSQTRKLDSLVAYSNRSFGPTFNLLSSNQTHNMFYHGNALVSYSRKFEASAEASYPILWTYSSLTPQISINAERESYFGGDGLTFNLVRKSHYIPSADFSVVYKDSESSRLGISPERGRTTFGGVRAYNDSGTKSYKGILKDTEYFDLGKHVVLSPAIKGAITSRTNRNLYTPDVFVTGRLSRILNNLPGDDFDNLYIRGYPQTTFAVKSAIIHSYDLRFPVGRIFRGWGTHPIFLENLSGFVFGETTYLPTARAAARFLPSAGAGLRLETDILIHLPLTLNLEYDKGFKNLYGGKGELIFGVNAGYIGF
ncbi:MAG: PD40 domain-containing protein [Methylotenera sp.]|nr:PD40 domain-containing protein [Oligoflexia bacterium]